MQAKFMMEENISNMLQQIDAQIEENFPQYHHLFISYSGPQSFDDSMKDCLNYDVNYKVHIRKHSIQNRDPSLGDAMENVETFDNSRISLQICSDCDEMRVIGSRAAKKYPLCHYKLRAEISEILVPYSTWGYVTRT